MFSHLFTTSFWAHEKKKKKTGPCSTDKGTKLCSNGSMECRPRSVFCDGHKNCLYGEDESPLQCGCLDPLKFQCYLGGVLQCLYNMKKCDGMPDCDDKSDELNCELVYYIFFRTTKNACVCAHTHHTHVYTYAYTHIHTHTQEHTYTHTHTHTSIHTHTCTHTHIHTHAYTHKNTCTHIYTSSHSYTQLQSMLLYGCNNMSKFATVYPH